MRRRYHFGLTFWIYCTITVLVALVAMNTGLNLLFWVFGAMASALVVSGFVSGAMMMNVQVRRIVAAHGVAGEPLMIRYAVRNTSRLLPAFGIDLEERPVGGPGGWERFTAPGHGWVMHAGPRETVHGEAVLRPTRRGVARFDGIRVSSLFPFGLLRKSVTAHHPQHVLVFPRVMRLRRDVLRAVAPPSSIGTRVSSRAGVGDDFFGLRAYRPGDRLRDVAWKRTANRDELLVIERARPHPPRLRVVLDLRTPTAHLRVSRDEPRSARGLEEDAITLAASIVHAADVAGYEFGLTVLGCEATAVPVRRSFWHRNRVLAELARIDLDAPRAGRDAIPPVEREGAAVVVVHPDRVDPAVGGAHAWSFTGRQLATLSEGPLPSSAWGMDPLVAGPLEDRAGAGAAAGESAA